MKALLINQAETFSAQWFMAFIFTLTLGSKREKLSMIKLERIALEFAQSKKFANIENRKAT